MNNFAIIGLIFMGCMVTAFWASHASASYQPCDDTNLCIEQIIQQNARIEKKIDWGNCASAHIETKSYWYENGWGKPKDLNANYYEELVKICGEMPK